MKRKEPKYETHTLYYINVILIIGAFILKLYDIVYSRSMIDIYGYSIETNPFAPFLFNNPFLHFIITMIPIVALFMLNYMFRENYYYLIAVTSFLIIINIYFAMVLQNNFQVAVLLEG